jgi:alpha-1,3-glucosyltransferase
LPGAETRVAVLVLLNACLLLVDHVHFQYNGFLVGVLLASIGALRKCAASDGPREQARWGLAGGAAFAALLGLKHLYLPLAFVYFVHLLFGFCRVNGRFSLGHFAALGVVVLTVLGAPFLFIILDDVAASGGSLLSSTQTQLRQISGRLFPFGGAAEECRVVLGDATATLTNACHERGLVHAYWAANFWALYLTADRVLIKALQILHATAPALARALPLLPAAAGGASATAGLVGRVTIQVLPQITPALAAVLTSVAMRPAVAATAAAAVRTAGRDTAVFERSLAHASLSAFVFGWHVHEKAILGALAPLSLLAAAARPTRDAAQLLRLSALGGFALFPLFTHPRETPTKLLVFLASLRLAHLAAGAPRLASIDRAGAVALAALFLFNEVAHPLVFAPRHRFEFLPLMLTSTLCATGICACWAASAAQLTADAARYLGGKGGTEKRQP